MHGLFGNTLRNVVSAANDPIFFLPHTNVDRLLERWIRMNKPDVYQVRNTTCLAVYFGTNNAMPNLRRVQSS